MSRTARLRSHSVVSTALALLSDRQLGRLVDEAPPLGAGIGGAAVALEIAGVPVFAKRVPLTDLERQPGNVRSTANMFGLPTACQYGVGGPGFGVWRELAANVMTTNWVLGGQSESFPLMYHWRVLPGAVPTPEEHADVEGAVAYWGGLSAVRERILAAARSTATVVLFLEHLPQTLHEWLTEQVALGTDAIEAACVMVERQLIADVAFMNANGLTHFDAHFRNILTDGRRLYLADFGLATSPRFDLSPAERDFLAANSSHDAAYAVTTLVNWLVTALIGAVGPRPFTARERNELVRRYAAGEEPPNLPPAAAAIIRRYAPVGTALNEFYWHLHGTSRATPYPADEIERVIGAVGSELRPVGT
ncbi:serine/threonine protein phosphatase [Micromonospora sp. NBC_01699]|uniref:serine/threonine protein phosphatase n=1 Tax=Micromonospora sp. NBC_01699 TaxID=2975984 RepID=UPI002E27C88E|nr:serine/threonine protein phosphatase [Micromonospora sp. NBC_01699]